MRTAQRVHNQRHNPSGRHAEYSLDSMLTCPGCGGRNPPEFEVCPFCNLRLGEQANGSRARRARLAALLFLVVLVSTVLLVLTRTVPIA